MVLLTVHAVPSSSCQGFLASLMQTQIHIHPYEYLILSWILAPGISCVIQLQVQTRTEEKCICFSVFSNILSYLKKKIGTSRFPSFLIVLSLLHLCLFTPCLYGNVPVFKISLHVVSDLHAPFIIGSLMRITEEIIVIAIRKCPGGTGPSCLVLNRDAH